MTSRSAPNESTIATHGTLFWSLTDLHRGATRPRVDVGIHPEAAT
jgi:hypothetical protein